MKRHVRTLICLIASGLVVFGGMEIGLEYLRHRFRQGEISLWHYVIGAILVMLGIFLFLTSSRLAEQLTDDFDE
jgi:divalent metal cation (Fe/Co/Zn/Cd) transporter